MMNLIAYADGSRDLIDIAELIDEDAFTLVDIAQTLLNMGVLIRLD
jgi:aminopeptidase-like protein